MKQERSNYTFNINGNASMVNDLIQSYIQANNFKQEEKKGETYYVSKDIMIGNRYFNYHITDNQLVISAWIRGSLGESGIEKQGLAASNPIIMSYKESLNKLFSEIEKISSQMSNESISNDTAQIDKTSFTQNFQKDITSKQEKMCEIGFWLSIFGLLCSFMGIAYGIFVYLFEFYFAAQGLKTRKRKKAITTIVLAIISILIIVLELVLNQ